MGETSNLDPRPVIRVHIRTLQSSSGRLKSRDITEQLFLPLSLSAFVLCVGINLSNEATVAALALSGIFAAFFFQLSVQLLDRAASWAESGPEPGEATSSYALLLEDLSANTSYAALVAILSAGSALTAGIITSGWQERVSNSILILVLAHLITTLLLVSSRVFALTRARLVIARVGRSNSTHD